MPGVVIQAMRSIQEDFSSERCAVTQYVVGSPACKDCQYFGVLSETNKVVICNMTVEAKVEKK
jgi:hypothetical protein